MNNTHLLRTALVTGSTSGIGLELTRKLLTDQWQVIGLNRSAFPEHPDIQAALASGQLYAVQADLTNYSSLHAALEHIRFKTKAIDVLFNNAGEARPDFCTQPKVMNFILSFRPSFLTSFIESFTLCCVKVG